MAVNRRPPFPLPEVSSAPSWFEFSSFLLTFAAEADMFSQAGVTYRRLREYLVALNPVSPWTGERLFGVKFSVQKPTTCCFPHNVAADERGSQSKRRSRAPFITNTPRRMEKTSSASQNRSYYLAPICWFTAVSFLKITPEMNTTCNYHFY